MNYLFVRNRLIEEFFIHKHALITFVLAGASADLLHEYFRLLIFCEGR